MSTNVTLTPDGFNSKITQEVGYLKTLFVKSSVKKFTLLFRASENKFSADSFHKCCDNVTQTLTLIKTEYGKVIGGYTPLSWNSSEKHWAADKSIESFIFSVDMR